MNQRVKCPKCEKEGRFEKASKQTFRINHDFTKNGKKTLDRCYLGSPYSIIKKLQTVEKIRPDLANRDLVEKVLEELKNNDKNKNNTVLFEILELNHKLGFGWNYETHDLVKQDNCPHCKQKIAVRYRRIGKNPTVTNGKYNIEKLEIEEGKSGHTSRFKNKFTKKLKNKFERGVEKGNSKKDMFYEDVKC